MPTDSEPEIIKAPLNSKLRKLYADPKFMKEYRKELAKERKRLGLRAEGTGEEK